MAACTPSATHFCVTHDGAAYVINGGAEHATLLLNAGTSYVFEAAATFSSHPFILTSNSSGGDSATPFVVGDGVTGGGGTTQIANVGEMLNYTPTNGQIGGAVYYQCHVHTGMGGTIAVGVAGASTDMAILASGDMAASVGDLAAATAPDMSNVTSPPASSSSCSYSAHPPVANNGALWIVMVALAALTARRRNLRVQLAESR